MSLDRRTTPFRADLAAARLRGVVEAERYVVAEPARLVAASAPMRRDPRPDCPLDTEILCGEALDVYERRDGWAWVQSGSDGYVGWVPAQAVGDREPAPTHRVRVPRSFRYPGADLKFPARDWLSLGARVRVTGEAVTRGTRYALLGDGTAMVAHHLAPLAATVEDWVSVAESLLESPYLWGGRTSLGLDCSALVQLALAEAGIAAPRDSDTQQAELGAALDLSAGLPELRRGDLVFWRGHVGIMSDGSTLLHANGHSMSVAKEPLAEAVARIAAHEFGAVTAVRRLA